jgi:signal transduction histidine kinase
MLISCQDATERVRSLAPHLEVSLSTSADTAVVLANPGACRHVLANLVENAMRHAHSSIAVELNRSDSRTVVTVRDDGPGLPSGSEDVAFEPFVSLDGAGGSGLGLPLARRLAQSLGGDLCYRAGAFVLELPSDPSAPPEPPARPSPPSGRAGRARSRRP